MRRLLKLARKRPDLGAIFGVIALFVGFSVFDPQGFLNPFTMNNITQGAAMLGIIAMGQALVIMNKEIDLSVGSVYGIVGITYISMEPTLGVIGSFLAAMLLAAVIGLLNAFLVVRLGLVSMIVTLGGLFFYRGAIYVATGGNVSSFAQDARDHWFNLLLGGQTLGYANAVFWALALLLVLSFVMAFTRFGNHLLAVGGDEASARAQGVRVGFTKTLAFMLCSMMAGFAAILTLASRPQTHVTLGFQLELEAIASAVIGGCALTGGRGSILGALLGAVVLTMVRYEMIALGAPTSWFITFVGALLVLAVIGNNALSKRVAA